MTPPDNKASLEDQATVWFARLRSDTATEGDWTRFEAWLSADPANHAAFAAVESLWVDLDLASGGPSIATQDAIVVPFVRRPSRPSGRIWAVGVGIAAAITLAVLLPTISRMQPAQTLTTVQTAKNERKSVMLADGTRIDLNAATKITYRRAGNVRSVALVGGEAAFSVAHDPLRPFSVRAGDRTITDIGTVFDVARLDDAVQVTVDQGEVSVAPTAKSGEAATAVRAGLQLLHRNGALESSLTRIDGDAALAWRSGRLVYKDTTLAVIVSDLNRYFPTPIRIQGEKAAGLKFSGVLVLDSEKAVVGRLQVYLPVSVSHAPDGIWISAR